MSNNKNMLHLSPYFYNYAESDNKTESSHGNASTAVRSFYTSLHNVSVSRDALRVVAAKATLTSN